MHALTELNVTPLLDLCFCLLIIFMIATPVLEQTTNIDLPVATKLPSPPTDTSKKPPARVIALDKSGVLSFDGKIVTEGQLGEALKAIAALPEAQRPPIRVRCDGHMYHQRWVDLMSIAARAGISDVGFDTEVQD